jgi:heterodisulfide reductase subunit B
VRTVAYYKGCLASLSAKELDISTQALAPKVGLELIELEAVTCCGAGDIRGGTDSTSTSTGICPRSHSGPP